MALCTYVHKHKHTHKNAHTQEMYSLLTVFVWRIELYVLKAVILSDQTTAV